jgi:hypothetical protein
MNYFSIMLISSSLLIANQLDENFATAINPHDISLTIYTKNIAMVKEKRTASIEKSGRVKIMYSGIPSSIDTSSVMATFRPQATLYSQNYSSDTISYDSLLKYHLGKTIHYTEKDNSVEILEGTLISLSPILIREKNYGAIYQPHQLFFPDIPKDMAIKPSLFWNIETLSNRLDIDLTYLTKGISWSSDYNINITDSQRLSINGWITIKNYSGATYKDADISVIAGNINIDRNQDALRLYKAKMLRARAERKKENKVTTQSIMGYHLYKIPFKETIKDRETKQIAFIKKDGIKYDRYSINKESLYFNNFRERELKFTQIIEFENSIKNRLGIALPEGKIRVYTKDKSQKSRFVGSTYINNMPKEEIVKVSIGEHFDITGKESVNKYINTPNHKFISYTLNVKNRGDKVEIVKISKKVPIDSGKLVIKESCKEQCSKTRLDAFTTLYTISLEPKEVYSMDISYDNVK